jgi:hypothetical protein
MEYYLHLEYNLNNNGLVLETHWIELGIPARTIYLGLIIWAGYKGYRKWRKYAYDERG